jgi:hypothetical protein
LKQLGEAKKGEEGKREFKGPVGWLLGQQLLSGAKWMAIYALYGGKLDSRDWMKGSVEDLSQDRQEDGAYWFDYISDTGDSQRATYNVAYLCLSDLHLPGEECALGSDRVDLRGGPDFSYRLPRGRFLFVGGDTAYHIADLESLVERFQTPFNWAYEERYGGQRPPDSVRPIFAIPANHDYYDFLDGFNRQFRTPLEGKSQLELKGFEARQSASFVALKLPQDWWLLGLDSQEGKADRRQKAFFKAILNPDSETYTHPKPSKLIVATPEPSTVFGQWATEKNKKGTMIETFNALGLTPAFTEEHKGVLPESECRLDISGDIHHYARHWGHGPNDPGDSSRTNYASVVAGGGGAFLHPTHTDVKQVPQNSLYPSRGDAHRLMVKRLLNPWNIAGGGYVWLAGAIAALLIYFAVTIPQSSWSLFGLIEDALRPCGGADCGNGLLARIQAALSPGQAATPPFFSGFMFDLIYAIALAGFLVWWMPRLGELREKLAAKGVEWREAWLRFLGPCLLAGVPLLIFIGIPGKAYPHPFLASMILTVFTVAAVLALVISRRYSNLLVDRAKRKRIRRVDKIPLWLFNFFALLSLCYGLWRYGNYPVAVMFSDVVTLVVGLSVVAGLVLLAGVAGAKLVTDKLAKKRFWGIGVWHAVVQLLVPLFLLVYGSWTAIFAVTVIVLTATYAMARYVEEKYKHDQDLAQLEDAAKLLWWSWVALGVFPLSIIFWGEPVPVDGLRLAAAFLLGAVYGCVWFGWYVAVTMSLNGHNNEAGGGARSEQYRHFIRFKLTPDTLTGYVIGIDKPVDHFRDDPKFRLVDVFTVRKGA